MSVIKSSPLMLYREIFAICSEIRTKHMNTLCGQNTEFLYATAVCAYSDHWVLDG